MTAPAARRAGGPLRGGRRLAVAAAAQLALAATSGQTLEGTVVIGGTEASLDLEATTPVATGEWGTATATLTGLGRGSDLEVTLHGDGDLIIRPRASWRFARVSGDRAVRWRFCRDQAGLAVVMATASYLDADGTRQSLTSPARVVEFVDTGGRACVGGGRP
jgi:hypothetical protein